MSFLTLLGVEFQKIRRSGILWILLAAVILLWLPSIWNAPMNFQMQAEGISPEHNFFIQGFLGMTWFLFPGSMVVVTVLLIQTERSNHGILKMLALPVSTCKLCLAKFAVLLALAAAQVLMAVGMYYLSAAIVTGTQDYPFLLPLPFVCQEAGLLFLSALPMLAVYWLLAVGIQTPVFSVGIGLALIVPSVLMINTRFWFLYPFSYPFFLLTAEYGRLAVNLETAQGKLLPWLPVACCIMIFSIVLACLRFGQAEAPSGYTCMSKKQDVDKERR